MPLKLDRSVGQSVTFPGDTPTDDIVVVVDEIFTDRCGRPKVRLSCVAHPEQAIYRSERWRKLQAEEAAEGRSQGK